MEHSPNGVINSLVAAFHGAVLMMSFSTSGQEIEVKVVVKKLANARTAIEFATLVHVDISILGASTKVALEPASEPSNRRNLGTEATTVKFLGVMVIDQKIACFTADPNVGVSIAIVKLGGLASKGKIYAKTLERFVSGASVGVPTSASLGFGSQTDGAVVQNRGAQSEFGNPFGKEMSSSQFVIRTVAKALVPEKTFGSSRECVDPELMSDRIVRMVEGGKKTRGEVASQGSRGGR